MIRSSIVTAAAALVLLTSIAGAQATTAADTTKPVAKLIGAKTGEIACVVNTSYGINVASLGLPLKSGDVVLTLNDDTEVLGDDWLRRMVEQVLRPKGI